MRSRRSRRRLVPALLAVVLIGLLAGGAWVWWVFEGAVPMLEGSLALEGLSAPVEIQRDAAGAATITAANRLDLARATGFLHDQERFFQMDLLRRSGAGELSGLVGAIAVPADIPHRLHRFRARAEAILARLPKGQTALLDAYTAGVNAGLAALARKPFEYTLLRIEPQPWHAEDTLLVVYAMYFDLQDSDDWAQRRLGLARETLGPALADFLYPTSNAEDAPLDGSVIAEPPMPGAAGTAAAPVPAAPPPSPKGSNAFAVSGKLTGTGSAIVANDMHLALRVPSIWFRMRLRVTGGEGGALDLDGVTLPGTPMLVTGSNTHIAWGFTDSYMTTGDAVLLDPVPGNERQYLTPDGPKTLDAVTEKICPAHADCRDLVVEESIWGPVVSHDALGRRIVWRWCAHDANAVDFDGPLALERATSVAEAIIAAHRAGIPQQNFVVGDRDGHIGWTIIGRVPKRVGLDDNLPHSWTDGTRGWQGYLTADQVPAIVDPPGGRIWTANNRIVGGDMLKLLGDPGYANPARAHQIRDDLDARDHFAEGDLLAIQLDARTPVLAPWQALLLQSAGARAGDPRFAAMLPYLRDWGGAADPGSVGYRLVRSFEEEGVKLVYGGFGGAIQKAAGADAGPLSPSQAARPALRLLGARPAALVPPPYADWDAADAALLDRLAQRVKDEAGGDLAKFTWGARNHVAIRHPLARAVPLLGYLTDPPDEAVAGDGLAPRVVTPGQGASERWVVSPGHEADGILELPVGNAADPLTPYYLAGHRDWVEGRPSPLLPGPVKWVLTLRPA